MNHREVALAEEALLGAVFLDGAVALDAVADLVTPEQFLVAAHGHVFAALRDLVADEKQPDPVLVTELLGRRRLLDDAVSRDLPFQLSAGVGAAANVRHYAEQIRGAWMRRRVMLEAQSVLEDRETPGPELAARLALRMSEIECAAVKPATRIGALAEQRVRHLDRQARAARDGKPLGEMIPTGFSAVDELLGGLGIGHLVIVAARPGIGKTSFVTALLDNVASHGTAAHLFQLEDYGESVADRVLSRRGKLLSALLRDGARLLPEHWERLVKAADSTANLPLWVDDQHGLTLHDVTARMRRAARDNAVRLFVLDNLAEVELDVREREGDRYDRALGRVARRYRDACKAVGAAGILVVHLNREIERRSDRTPKMSDLKNSGDLEDAAHVVMFLDRDPKAPGTFSLDVVKHRNGPIGKLTLRWLEDYMAVENAD